MSTVHVKCVTLWLVGRDGYDGALVLRSRRLLEHAHGFRETFDGGVCVHKGDDGEPMYPWRRTQVGAVNAYRERIRADMKSLEDRLRRLRSDLDEAMDLL